MALNGHSAFPKDPAVLNLHHQHVNVIPSTLVGEILPLCREAVSVFYSPNRLRQYAKDETKLSMTAGTHNQPQGETAYSLYLRGHSWKDVMSCMHSKTWQTHWICQPGACSQNSGTPYHRKWQNVQRFANRIITGFHTTLNPKLLRSRKLPLWSTRV